MDRASLASKEQVRTLSDRWGSPSDHTSAYERPAFSDTLLRSLGVRVWSYVVSVIADDRIRNWVVEWRPPTFETATGALFLVPVVAVALFVGSR
jgi:hypothetical protein